MGMSVIGSGDQWFATRERTGRIYRLIDMARKDQRAGKRNWAIVQLGESGDPRAVLPLVDCCGDRDPEIRNNAINALGKIGSGRAVDALVERIDDNNEEIRIRINAAAALGAIRSEHARDELRSHGADPGLNRVIRTAIAEVMGRAEKK